MITIAQKPDGSPYFLSDNDRAQHLYPIGKTGTGKSTLIQNMIAQDIAAGRGLCLIDPHGDLAHDVLSYIPPERRHDLIYLNATDLNFPVGFNPLSRVAQDQKDKVADDIVASFRHAQQFDSWGPQMDWIMLNAVRLALDNNDSFLGVRRILLDKAYRTELLDKCTSSVTIDFWQREFQQYLKKPGDPTTPILNKLGKALSSLHLKNILCQRYAKLNMRSVMDQGQILIVNLSKGQLGESNTQLLGSLIVSAITNAALSRADISPEERRPFYLYADEFGSFVTESFDTILSEARKYKLCLTLSHQFLGQLPPKLQQAVLGNTGSIIAFRLGQEDAVKLAPVIGRNDPSDLTNLNNYAMWGRFLRSGWPSRAESLTGYPPAPKLCDPAHLIKNSRNNFGRDRASVEREIDAFLNADKPKRKGSW